LQGVKKEENVAKRYGKGAPEGAARREKRGTPHGEAIDVSLDPSTERGGAERHF